MFVRSVGTTPVDANVVPRSSCVMLLSETVTQVSKVACEELCIAAGFGLQTNNCVGSLGFQCHAMRLYCGVC